MPRWTLPSLPSRREANSIGQASEESLLETVHRLQDRVGTGQEQGSEAGGPDINLRREAISALLSRMPLAELESKLPKEGQRILATIRQDLEWIRAAERQEIVEGKPFNFEWSLNPMSTPDVLDELAVRRAAAATVAAQAIEADPESAYDATNDCLLGHLSLDDANLRASVLADTLIQFRAKRRSEAMVDAELAPEDDHEGQASGRMGSSGTVSAFEQRLALTSLPTGNSFDAKREYALARMVIGGATAGSVNGIYIGRNAVGGLPTYMGFSVAYDGIDEEEGFGTNFHDAIHKSYSANTANAVEHYLKDRVFRAGPEKDRPEILGLLVDAASARTVDEAKAILDDVQTRFGHEVPDLDRATTPDKMNAALVRHLKKQTDLRGLKTANAVGLLKALRLILVTYKSVVLDRPSVEELEEKLPFAQSAWPEVAQLIGAMKKDDHPAQLEAIGRARTAMRKAFFDTDSAYEKQMLLRLDRRIELLATEIIGTTVDKVEGTDDPKHLGETLLAVRSAIRNVRASGLEEMRGRRKTANTENLSKLEKQLDRMLKSKSASVDEIRALMTKVYASATEISDTMSVFFKRRESAIRFSKIDIEPDPDFTGNLVKETPLQHLLSLSNHARTFGMKTEISPDEIRFVGGMRVLNSTGPRVYERILVADTPEKLKTYKPTVNDLCVVREANEKNLVYGGGLVLDTKDAGPGLSHAAVFAKGHGINAIALPNLDDAIDTFFDKAAQSGAEGFYVDPRAESFSIKPLASAIDEGLLAPGDVDKMRPGFNLETDYFDVDDAARRVLIDQTKLHLSDEHSTRHIELLTPDLTDKLNLDGPASFDRLGEYHIDQVRQVSGEKGAVLVDLSKSERLAALGVKVPPGGVVPPFVVSDLLKASKVGTKSLADAWMEATDNPPDDLAKMKRTTIASLKKALIDGNKPTELGKQLLAKFGADFGLDPSGDWIFRSSFTAEDRPYKSGAGQYDSFVVKGKPSRTLVKRRLEAIAKVIGAAWNESAVESNRQTGMKLEHVWPAIVVQQALDPTVSGVGFSRGKTGGFGEATYQATPKFGGGVAGGDCEEGVISGRETTISQNYKTRKKSLLSPAQQQKLREAIMAIEEDFHERIEPGQGHAVDVEWAFVGDQLHILQARVITGI